jgi:hypothetical protein
MVNTPVSYLLNIRRGDTDNKVTPVTKIPKIKNNKRSLQTYEQKKRDVKTTAAILRISEQGKSKARTG